MPAVPKPIHLTRRERRILELLHPDGTLAAGQTVTAELYHRGFLEWAKFGRFQLSAKGRAAVERLSALSRGEG